MKKTNRKQAAVVFAVLGILAALLICSFLLCPDRTLAISIDRSALSYVICSFDGLGPHQLDYAEHHAALNELIGTLEGDYRYTRTLRPGKTDGGGPDTISFYGTDGTVLCRVIYRNGQVGVHERSSRYALYEKTSGEAIELAGFAAYLKQYGEFTR